MSGPLEKSDSLSIRCPSCTQRFSVDASLMDKVVECGACDTRFRINENVIQRTKKFYPGERVAPELNRFQRVPMSTSVPQGLKQVQYAEFHHPEKLEPTSPQRILAGIFGVSIMVMIALLFIFASAPGALFGSMPQQNKLFVAGFVSLLGLVLLVYANPKARFKAVFFGLLLSAGLVSLPLMVKGRGGVVAVDNDADQRLEAPVVSGEESAEEADPVEDLRERFVTRPLESEQERMAKSGEGKQAYGVYLTGLLTRHLYPIRDYLIRETGAELSSHPYPRDGGDYLMVLTGVSMDIDGVARVAARLGSTTEVHPKLGVVLVIVDNALFAEVPAEKVGNPEDPAFYDLNRRELENMDLDRVKRAVERLASVEPKVYRTDLAQRFTELLTKPGVNFQDELARALLVWAEDDQEAAKAGHQALQTLVAAGMTPPDNLVALISRAQLEDAIPSMHKIWLQNPVIWERRYAEFGPAIEKSVAGVLKSEDPALRHSAIKLLERVGTTESLPALRPLATSDNAETRVLAERAIEKIEGR